MTENRQNSQEIAKDAAAKLASEFVQNGMLIGLGTGSTALKLIKYLAKRCQEGLKIQAVATSMATTEFAQKLGIALVDLKTPLDLDIDGADEVDENKQLIKGGGGALLREKIVATSSKEMIVMIDSTKMVKQLGAFPLPIEIVQFGYEETMRKLASIGYMGHLRVKNGKTFVTDGDNFIIDVLLSNPTDLFQIERTLKSVVGVIETGLFLNLASKVIVGYPDGSCKTL